MWRRREKSPFETSVQVADGGVDWSGLVSGVPTVFCRIDSGDISPKRILFTSIQSTPVSNLYFYSVSVLMGEEIWKTEGKGDSERHQSSKNLVKNVGFVQLVYTQSPTSIQTPIQPRLGDVRGYK
jgi:hypothetical protein